LTYGFGWVGLGRDVSVFGGLGRFGSKFFSFLLGWVGYTTAKVPRIRKDYVSAFKAWLDKIWLHQAVKLLVRSGWIRIFPLVVRWVGLGQSADGLGWIGSHKMDPWTTLSRLFHD